MLSILFLLAAVGFIVLSTTRWRLHPFLALLLAAIGFGAVSRMPLPDILAAVKAGFGGTIGNVGIIIIAGTAIGIFLEKSGGALAMAEAILHRVGRRRVPQAMSLIGYITSIPVFADSGFVIFSPLNRALTKRAGLSLATTSIALALGLMVSHTLIPPTPGPIVAAGILGADLGRVLAIAVPISLVVLAASCVWAIKVASRHAIDPAPDLDEFQLADRLRDAPSAARSFFPILVPLLLILLQSVSRLPSHPLGEGILASTVGFLGDPVIALLIGMFIAFTLPKTFDRSMLDQSGWVGQAVVGAAVIIFITGAGGAFGEVLRASGMANQVGNLLVPLGLGLWLPFILSAAIRAAQGSATVAIIASAGIVLPLLPSLGLDSETGRALATVAICSGGFFASHANDSFFWVVTQMSGMSPSLGYKLLTGGSTMMALVSGTLVWVTGIFLL
jgi:GntP family gluconate:H+ symporter